MNLVKAIYCNQYFELKQKGKEDQARSLGTRLVTIFLSLNIISVFILLIVISPAFKEFSTDIVKTLFGWRIVRMVAKIAAGLVFLITYLIMKYTIGRISNYKNMIEEFETINTGTQKEISQKGLIAFTSSIVLFAISIVLVLIF